MESLMRGSAVYFFLLIVLRVSGRRTLSETTAFDFVLLLIVSETTQQAMVGADQSMTNAALLILTLVGWDFVLSFVKQRSPLLQRALEGSSVVILEDGKPLKKAMDRERVDIEDILEAAREKQGLETLDAIKRAVLERAGEISIIPK